MYYVFYIINIPSTKIYFFAALRVKGRYLINTTYAECKIAKMVKLSNLFRALKIHPLTLLVF